MLDASFDFVAHAAEFGELGLLIPARVCRVVERPVQRLFRPRQSWAGFLGAIAHGDDQVEILIGHFVDGFASVIADVDIQFLHDGDRQGMDVTGWFGSGGPGEPSATAQSIPQPFGHLGSAGIPSAQDEHVFLLVRSHGCLGQL